MNDLLSCFLCGEKYDSTGEHRPYVLVPCGHMFGHSCITAVLRDATCPIDRAPFDTCIPNQDVLRYLSGQISDTIRRDDERDERRVLRTRLAKLVDEADCLLAELRVRNGREHTFVLKDCQHLKSLISLSADELIARVVHNRDHLLSVIDMMQTKAKWALEKNYELEQRVAEHTRAYSRHIEAPLPTQKQQLSSAASLAAVDKEPAPPLGSTSLRSLSLADLGALCKDAQTQLQKLRTDAETCRVQFKCKFLKSNQSKSQNLIGSLIVNEINLTSKTASTSLPTPPGTIFEEDAKLA